MWPFRRKPVVGENTCERCRGCKQTHPLELLHYEYAHNRYVCGACAGLPVVIMKFG